MRSAVRWSEEGHGGNRRRAEVNRYDPARSRSTSPHRPCRHWQEAERRDRAVSAPHLAVCAARRAEDAIDTPGGAGAAPVQLSAFYEGAGERAGFGHGSVNRRLRADTDRQQRLDTEQVPPQGGVGSDPIQPRGTDWRGSSGSLTGRSRRSVPSSPSSASCCSSSSSSSRCSCVGRLLRHDLAAGGSGIRPDRCRLHPTRDGTESRRS